MAVKPDCIARAFAKLLARSCCEQWGGETIGGYPWVFLAFSLVVHAVYLPHMADGAHACNDVSVLVRSAYL